MGRKKKEVILTQPPRKKDAIEIKVRLDHRTVITITSLKALESWKERFPRAEVIGGEKEA